MNMYIAFDVGGTNTRLGLSADMNGFIKTVKFPTPQDPNEGANKIVQEIAILTAGEKPMGVAGGIAGIFDQKKDRLLRAPNLPMWGGKISKRELEKLWEMPVYLENDAALGGLGEAAIGAGRRKGIVAFLTVGTGIGGARIVNGLIDENHSGFEPGHQIIDYSGNLGSLEDFASGTAIWQINRETAENISDERVWEREAMILAIGVHNTIVYWSPEIVVLGGAVMNKVPMDKVRGYVAESLQVYKEIPPIEKAELGDECTLYGALELLRQKLGGGQVGGVEFFGRR